MTHTATRQPMREPLEHFVILQLTEMRERENRLRKTLDQLSSADGTCRPDILMRPARARGAWVQEAQRPRYLRHAGLTLM